MDRTPEHTPTTAPRAAHPPAFGELLRRFRVAAGWTQEELAERAYVSPRAVVNYESGVTLRPQRQTVRLLADALNLSDEERALLAAAARALRTPPVVPAPPAPPAPSSPPASPAHLPASLVPLLGRERELASLTALLAREDVRLLTVTGPGGVGKTRLALAAAAAVRDAYADGVYFVSLAPVREPEVLWLAAAQVLGVKPTGAQTPYDALHAWLRERHVLLVLDNFEHLLSEAVTVANLLRACAGVTVLATSRARLRLRGEHEYPLAPLAVPVGERGADAMAAVPAVRVFAHYARAVRPDFRVTAANAAAVAAICARLDGLPLALELAAAHMRHLTPDALRARLGAPLQVLSDGPRDAPERHRGLAEAVAWSHDLLTDDERRVFRRLAVFAGGWTVEAAAALCGDGAGGPPVTAMLASLADQSLVRVVPGWDGEPRYTMLETLREFAADRLVASGEEDAVDERRDDYFVALAARMPAGVRGDAEDRAWLSHIRAEDANWQACLRHLHERGAYERGVQLLGGIGMHWLRLGLSAHVRYWGARFAVRAEAGMPHSKAQMRALTVLATSFHIVGEQEKAIEYGEWALDIARDLGDVVALTSSLTNLASYLRDGGEYTRSAVVAQEAVSLLRGADEPGLLAAALIYLAATFYYTGEYDRAETALRESLALRHRHAGVRWVSLARQALACVLLQRGERDEADRLLRDGPLVPTFLAAHHDPAAKTAELDAARRALRRGAHDRAMVHAEEALRIAAAAGVETDRAYALVALGATALARGNDAEARRRADEGWVLALQVGAFPAAIGGMVLLARCHSHAGEYAAARLVVQRAMTLALDSFAQPAAAAQVLEAWGRFALDAGDTDEAVGKLFAALYLAHTYGEEYDAASAAALLALACQRRGQHAGALRLWAAADAVLAREGAVLLPADRAMHAAGIAAARVALGDAAADAGWAAGQAVSFDVLVAEAAHLVAEARPRLTT